MESPSSSGVSPPSPIKQEDAKDNSEVNKEEPESKNSVETVSSTLQAKDTTESPPPTPVTILGQIFPNKSRESLAAVLAKCQGDLVKSLETCARNKDEQYEEPPLKNKRKLFRPQEVTPQRHQKQSRRTPPKLLMPPFLNSKSAFAPLNPYSYRPMAALLSGATTTPSNSDLYPSFPPHPDLPFPPKEVLPFPPPFLSPAMYLGHNFMSPLSRFQHPSPLVNNRSSPSPPSSAFHRPNVSCLDTSCSQCLPKADSTEQNVALQNENIK